MQMQIHTSHNIRLKIYSNVVYILIISDAILQTCIVFMLKCHIRILSEKAIYFCFVRTTLVLSSVFFVHKLVLVEFINVRFSKVAGNIVLRHSGKYT